MFWREAHLHSNWVCAVVSELSSDVGCTAIKVECPSRWLGSGFGLCNGLAQTHANGSAATSIYLDFLPEGREALLLHLQTLLLAPGDADRKRILVDGLERHGLSVYGDLGVWR